MMILMYFILGFTILWVLYKATIPMLLFLIIAFGFSDKLESMKIPLFIIAVWIIITAPIPGLAFIAAGVYFNYLKKNENKENSDESSGTEHNTDT